MSSSFFAASETLNEHRLPTLPHLLARLLRCLEEDDFTSAVYDIIQVDPSLSAGILSLSCHLRSTNANPPRAITDGLNILGESDLQAFISTTAIQQFFANDIKKRATDNEGDSSQFYFLKQFWQKSLSCALIAKALARLTRYTFPQEAYMTGLLHDIGELVLSKNYPDDWLELLINTTSPESRREFESELFLSTHTDIGAELAQKWGLGDYAVDAIRYHHAPSETLLDAHHLSKLIHLASLLSEKGAKENQNTLSVAALFFNISPELSIEIIEQIEQQVLETANFYTVDLQSQALSGIDELQLKSFSNQAKSSALLQNSRQQLKSATTAFELRLKIKTMAELLFNYSNTQVLLLDKGEKSLKLTQDSIVLSAPNDNGMATSASAGQVIELSIPLATSKSWVAKSALERTIVSSLDPMDQRRSLTVVDRQLIRLTHAKDFICVPMIWKHELLGVLVMGTQASYSQCAKQSDLLTAFSHQAAQACWEFVNESQLPSDQIAIASMCRQAVEIAHEVNNPLTLIRNYTEALSLRFAKDSETQQELEIVKEELERASHILTRLRDLAPELPTSNDEVDINLEIRQLIKLFHGSLFSSTPDQPTTIQCDLELDDNLMPIKANRNALRQIVTNLVKNAVEAFQTEQNESTEPTDQNIQIKTHCSVNVNGRNFVELIIADNGKGIESERFTQLFEPITSEKGEGHSGLGLNITRNLVNDLGGSITCRRLNLGVEFQILLPFKPITIQEE
jgi:nitrogen-specific signal transduction histidine kinase/HD-like signal output (HDOD) protein